MNKAVTDGITFMPPQFSDGLDVWSSEDGTAGSATYQGALNAIYTPSDQDFGGALEMQKTQGVQKLRYMGQTPILPGCYLRIKAKIKAITGNLPNVRIAAWAGGAGDAHVSGLTEVGPEVSLTTYGQVVEISAIVGTGQRSGVDMPWGLGPIYGHFGLDLTGPNDGIVRIDGIEIEDVTSAFLRDMLSTVDVRDFGAVGDGVTDDHAAFEAADAAANGREVLISAGVHYLGDSVTFQSPVKIEGTVTMPVDKIFAMVQNFDLPDYIRVFGSNEEALRKAFQALLNNVAHETLDLGGLRFDISGPIDMQAAVSNRTVFSQRRVIRNGQISVKPSSKWDTEVLTSQATYSANNAKKLTGVANVASIPVGSLVEGNGVGREVYVAEKNIAAQEITLNLPLYDAGGTQVFTFRRFKYILDFSGFEELGKFTVSDVEFQCSGRCSAVLLPQNAKAFTFKDCFFTRPKNRGITSFANGDQGMLIDQCQFLSDEAPLAAVDRISIGLNANANDVKLRDNRATYFRHFAVLAGSSSIITGNHYFQGDGRQNSPRTAGLVLTRTNNRATIVGNYIDNNFIEWANEHDATPDFSSEFSFSSLNVSDNVFIVSHVAPWFTFMMVKPYGPGHFINGLNVNGNSFRIIGDNINRVESLDTSFAALDFDRVQNVTFANNTYSNVTIPSVNPAVIAHTEASPTQTWVIDANDKLPFGANAQRVDSFVLTQPLLDGAGGSYHGVPYVQVKQGPDKDQVHLQWEKPLRGAALVHIRIDDAL
ncbi:glycosyl hydrolase family 28-related protein [Roseovarius sp. EL26]|uniref:glycosyl hydrolase family 28-related protein n=1 Tax=Roseovarius sp. EL26 TaxID=2126672 RepID=UPI000EA13462|nr:glycosyl hydrolase family 28-related protein [Roseovarius sp. EL26]